jgi:hypothetical protein
MDGIGWFMPAAGSKSASRLLRHALPGLLISLIFALSSIARASDVFNDECEGDKPSWFIETGHPSTAVLDHGRTSQSPHGGETSELLRFKSTEAGREVAIVHEAPRARVTKDLRASLWVRTRALGVRLAIGVCFPHQIDPRTGKPLLGEVPGLAANSQGDWEELTCEANEAKMGALLLRIRAMFAKQIETKQFDFSDAYVDRISLLIPTTPGATEVQWDDLELSPIELTKPELVDTIDSGDSTRPSRLSWADSRILRDGKPFISRFVPYHGEPVDVLRGTFLNSVWVKQLDDRETLADLAGAGLNIYATPPMPLTEASEQADVSLAPFSQDTAPVDCWMLGQLEPEQLTNVAHWVEQLQDADRRYSRPLMGDVSAHVIEFHRHVPLLSASRHTPHTTTSFTEYQEFLRQLRRRALPGLPLGTLLPTETAEATLESRKAADALPVVEPETIALCTHVAMASGCKQLGFWTNTPLTDDAPGAIERLHMLRLLNIELELLEPWLSTGKILPVSEIRGFDQAQGKKKGAVFNPLASAWDSNPQANGGAESPLRATIMRADGGTGLLILADMLEPDSQFQPGPMTASNLRIMTQAFDDAGQAWEVTTTSLRQVPVDLKRVAGGIEVPLARLDQHAAIVMTSSQSVIEGLKRQVHAVRGMAAESWVALATAKLQRVEAVHRELQGLAPPLKEAGPNLEAAKRGLRKAEKDLKGGRYDEAREVSQAVLQLTRGVQRAYWEQAVSKQTSPVSSPHGICFQTLPDHWRLFNQIGKNPPTGENLLRSGDFDDQDAVVADGWRFESPFLRPETGVQADIALESRSGVQGRYALRMSAAPIRVERQPVIDEALITVTTPPMSVFSGQVIKITGKILIPSQPGALSGGIDGLMIYDTLKGSVGALRYRQASPNNKWESFTLYREVKESRDCHLIFELRGYGEVWIDDLQVTAMTLEVGVERE